jgi:hypothetical protein
VDELERGGPFQQRDTEPSPSSDAEKSFAGEEPPARPEGDAVDPGSQVMGRLPRTRPQRRSDRRPASTVKSNAGSPKAAATTPKAGTTPKKKPATPSRPRTSAAARSGSTNARTRAAGGHGARPPAETATRAAARKRAPGIPQLAAGAAVSAAKLPLKVTASVTRQATKLFGRGLRLR